MNEDTLKITGDTITVIGWTPDYEDRHRDRKSLVVTPKEHLFLRSIQSILDDEVVDKATSILSQTQASLPMFADLAEHRDDVVLKTIGGRYEVKVCLPNHQPITVLNATREDWTRLRGALEWIGRYGVAITWQINLSLVDGALSASPLLSRSIYGVHGGSPDFAPDHEQTALFRARNVPEEIRFGSLVSAIIPYVTPELWKSHAKMLGVKGFSPRYGFETTVLRELEGFTGKLLTRK